ncbi:MAG: hypothetical protein QM699_06300 [Amaricoccus sp.]|uniref:hypothetical protein n=1 Tax=Amaricoccus sp. TaxID=1872485 RepID=UPI0039E34F30
MRQAAAAASLALSIAAPAVAASRLPVDGVASGTDGFVVHPVHADLASLVGDFTVAGFEPKGPVDPFAGVQGSCFGAMDLEKNRMSGGGYCTLTDVRGEGLVLRWTAIAPVARGYREVWELVGGSGWWGDAGGKGTFVYLMDPETRRFNAGFKGEVVKP